MRVVVSQSLTSFIWSFVML
jgi:hypothetical protein